MFLYSVYDVVLEEFAPPFVAKNDKAASRLFLQSIRKMPSPNDLSLWKVGDFVPDGIGNLHSDGKIPKEKAFPNCEFDIIVGCVPVQVPVEVNGSDE